MAEDANYREMVDKYGTEAVKEGKLTGTTDTDYFYFLCPKCNGGGTEIMRIVDVGSVDGLEYAYHDISPKPKKLFHYSFELYCDKCKIHTVVKLTNCNGWQGGDITSESIGLRHKVIGPNE